MARSRGRAGLHIHIKSLGVYAVVIVNPGVSDLSVSFDNDQLVHSPPHQKLSIDPLLFARKQVVSLPPCLSLSTHTLTYFCIPVDTTT